MPRTIKSVVCPTCRGRRVIRELFAAPKNCATCRAVGTLTPAEFAEMEAFQKAREARKQAALEKGEGSIITPSRDLNFSSWYCSRCYVGGEISSLDENRKPKDAVTAVAGIVVAHRMENPKCVASICELRVR